MAHRAPVLKRKPLKRGVQCEDKKKIVETKTSPLSSELDLIRNVQYQCS